MTWHEIDEIAEALYEAKKDVDPLAVRFTDLRDWIAALPEWEDDIHGPMKQSSKQCRWNGTNSGRKTIPHERDRTHTALSAFCGALSAITDTASDI